MFEKTSELTEKSEYKKVTKDYNNNYGYNIGLNSVSSLGDTEKMDNFVNAKLKMKKR